MPKTQEELTQLKTEYETLNNKLKELTEDELKMVTGGNDTSTYKYVFTDKDWIYENNMKNIIIFIEENVSTNDDSRKIRCIKENRGKVLDGGGSGEIYYSASTLLKCYQGNGGVLNAM